ncbi:hypothetical protein [Haloarcula litorea]|uniref:hypothetical protein n=1 Tax=Haloarcula litorea TaxID=3032579 RepID=UPI0023E8F616|nr:hypothetical protein [Halomicroarcula sp. GDY20]
MVNFPWRGGETGGDHADPEHPDAVVVCSFQDGTLVVHEDEVVIERVPRSKFAGKTIPMADLRGVDYAGGITVGYIQLEQRGVDADEGGLLSDPVDENTLHFTRSGRACAEEARDAILSRLSE